MIWLVIGLGNPGTAYRSTRHNVGFLVVERVARSWAIPFKKRREEAQVGEGRVGRRRVVLVKPLTYMNRSGVAVKKLIEALRVSLDHVVVVHDDLDLACGRIKIKKKGGHGGHKGVQSIIELLGSAAFVRVKVGIDKPRGREAGADYVLSPFTADERPRIKESVEQAVEAIETILASGVDQAMNQYN
jgi:PTH1 family peptidyl-tRNA hydrolase